MKTEEEISTADLQTRGTEIFSESKGSWEILRARWAKDNDLYDGIFDKEEQEYSTLLGVRRLFIRKTWAQTQRILTDLMEAIYDDPSELVALIQNKSLPRQSQDIFKCVINHRLRGNPINYYQETYEACLDAIKNKYCVIKVYPRLLVEKTPKKNVISETGDIPAEEFDEKVKYFCPAWETLPYEDVFFSPQATWKDYWKFPICHRKKISRADAKDRGFFDLEKAQPTVSESDKIKQQRKEKDGSPFSAQPSENKETQTFYVYEFWDFRRKDGRLESGSFVMGGGPESPEFVTRGWQWNELPYRYDQLEPVRPPFAVGVAIPRSHALPGDSFPEVTEGLQKETNASVNQEREAVAMAIRPPLIVFKDSGVDMFGLMSRKIGAVLQSDIPADQVARELSTQNPIPLSAPNRQRIDQDYSEISSITPMSMGSGRGADMPATNFSGLSANTNKKIQFILRNVLMTGIFPALNMLMRLEQEYETDEYIERVTGQRLGLKFEKAQDGSYLGASPYASIQGEYSFDIQTGISKQAQMGQWKTIIELINQANATSAQLLQMQVATADTVQFWSPNVAIEQMLKTMGQRNIDEMKIQSVQPPPPEAGGEQGFASQPSLSGPVNGAQEAMLAG